MKSTPRVALLLILLAGLAALRAAAQDVTVGDPVWFQSDPPPNELPKPKSRLRPDYPDEMRKSAEVGYVILTLFIDTSGKRLSANPIGTHIPLQRAVEAVLPDWNLKPGMRDGKPVNSRVWVPVVFNPKSAALKGADATPRLVAVGPVITSRPPTRAGLHAPGGALAAAPSVPAPQGSRRPEAPRRQEPARKQKPQRKARVS